VSSAAATGAKLRHVMRHALGKDGFRNHFAAEPLGEDWRAWELLVALGLAVRGKSLNRGELQYFHVSTAGVAALRKLYPRQYKRELKGALP